jgi:hypothetical protein
VVSEGKSAILGPAKRGVLQRLLQRFFPEKILATVARGRGAARRRRRRAARAKIKGFPLALKEIFLKFKVDFL